MRAIDWINLVYFSFFMLYSLGQPISREKRIRVIGFGIAGIGLTWLMQSTLADYRNVLPLATLLLAYWQPAPLFVKVNSGLQKQLSGFDRKFLPTGSRSKWLADYMELSYLLCYPFLPFCIAFLWYEDPGSMETLWNLVIPSSYPCYGMVPFLTVFPPWRVEPAEDSSQRAIRKLNFFVVRHFSNRLNTVPSAHVTASISAAMALWFFSPVAGAIALFLSASIGAGAVFGRYHYAVDVLLGAMVSAGWFLIYRFVMMI